MALHDAVSPDSRIALVFDGIIQESDLLSNRQQTDERFRSGSLRLLGQVRIRSDYVDPSIALITGLRRKGEGPVRRFKRKFLPLFGYKQLDDTTNDWLS